MTEVPCLIDSVNSGDVFILDTKQIVYLFYGSESNKIERQKVRTNQSAEVFSSFKIINLDLSWFKVRDYVIAINNREF